MSALVEIAAQLIFGTFDGLMGLGALRDRDLNRRNRNQKKARQAEKKLRELIKRNKQFEAEKNDNRS